MASSVPGDAPAACNLTEAAEVDSTGGGKAQLIIGIDFVRSRSVWMRRNIVINGVSS
jgi:hypothetical protein